MIAGKCFVRHFLGIRRILENGALGNVYCLPGLAGPADGMTKVESDTIPLPRHLESGAVRPVIPMSQKGFPPSEQAERDGRAH